MRKLVDTYSYEKIIEEKIDEKGNCTYPSHNSFLKAWYPKRCYQTKMNVEDLPEYYCDVHMHWTTYNVISAKDVVDIKYKWVKENHFMKDSVIYISYTGKIEEYHEKYTIEGKEITSVFPSYRNSDTMVFGYDILKFLAYAHKYSDYDLSEIREQFVEQCRWLEENEHRFAPDLTGFNDYGEWFDNKMKIENYDD